MGTVGSDCCNIDRSNRIEAEVTAEIKESQKRTTTIHCVAIEIIKLQKKFEALSYSLQERSAEVTRLNAEIEKLQNERQIVFKSMEKKKSEITEVDVVFDEIEDESEGHPTQVSLQLLMLFEPAKDKYMYFGNDLEYCK